jgi:cytochrome c oxidase assembly protein subunit 11
MNKNTRTLLTVFAIVVGMAGLAFASVPLYDAFCRVTGFGGTTQISSSAPPESEITDQEIAVFFNTDTGQNLDWQFSAEKRKMTVRVGEQKLINFIAKSNETEPVAGTAIYNVTPAKAGKYFHKTQCFCFDRQVLVPGQEMNMPVAFYIDPSIANDRNMEDVQAITLSYSFYEADSKALDEALEAFYNSGE